MNIKQVHNFVYSIDTADSPLRTTNTSADSFFCEAWDNSVSNLCENKYSALPKAAQDVLKTIDTKKCLKR